MKALPQPKRTIRYHSLRFIRLKGAPHTLILGLAIGVFIGITPSIPLHTILSLASALILLASKISALAGTLLAGNPLIIVPLYYFSLKIGCWLTRADLSWERVQCDQDFLRKAPGFGESLYSLGNLGQKTLLALLLGGVILALPLMLIAYFVSRYFFAAFRRKRREAHILK